LIVLAAGGVFLYLILGKVEKKDEVSNDKNGNDKQDI
jgi:hypothetical protein